MRIYRLNHKVIRVYGNAGAFLKGLTSNTLEAPRNAFLNMHGRIVATFDQVKSGPDEYVLVVAASAWEPLRVHTDRYARLNKTTLEPTALNAYFDLDGDAPLRPGDQVISQKKGRLLLTNCAIPNSVGEDEFTQFRLDLHIPLQGVDYTDEMVLNVDEHEYVSYTKGCFLGQEPVAKVHNRSRPTWKLGVAFADQLPAEVAVKMTSRVKDLDSGRIRGFVMVPNRP